jgi:PKD repeat protein
MIRKLSFSRIAVSCFAAFFALSVFSFTADTGFLRTGTAHAASDISIFAMDNPGIKKAIEVQSRNADRLMDIQGVVGHGVGVSSEGEPVIKVYVTRAGIPAIPSVLENVPVKTIVTGMVTAYADPTAKFPRPVPIGVSTGHPDITAGTIGCRVVDTLGNVYALSNNHVYANENEAIIGDNVLQPGPYDGGQDPVDAIGRLHAFVPINFSGQNNTVDAAIAISSPSMLGTATPAGDGYGIPGTTIQKPSAGLKVQKYGRTTGWTHGEISEVNVTVDVCFQSKGPYKCVKMARFVNQIGITPGTFSAGGDSGSLIVTNDGNKYPVGLLFAGGSTRTFANPIDAVLTAFNVEVDGSTEPSPPPGNQPPTAKFLYSTDGLTVNFTDLSTDDGSIAAWNWVFGDTATSTYQHPSHTYANAGNYNVTLTVTDNSGATGSTSQTVTVSVSGQISLSAAGYKVKGRQKADLTWSGATATNVDIYRNGTKIITTANDGSHTDSIDKVGGGSYTYQVCEPGTSNCSNQAVVNF